MTPAAVHVWALDETGSQKTQLSTTLIGGNQLRFTVDTGAHKTLWYALLRPLAAPQLQFLPMIRHLQLSWPAVPGATGYRVYRSPTNPYFSPGTPWRTTNATTVLETGRAGPARQHDVLRRAVVQRLRAVGLLGLRGRVRVPVDQMNGIQALLEVLAAGGIRYLLGTPGSIELPLSDALSTDRRCACILALPELPLLATPGDMVAMARPWTKGLSERLPASHPEPVSHHCRTRRITP